MIYSTHNNNNNNNLMEFESNKVFDRYTDRQQMK